MLKTLIAAAFALLITIPAFAAGPSQMWRLEVTGTDEGVLEISEIGLHAVAGGDSVTDLIRNHTFEESNPAGATSWSIPHNLGIQHKTASVTIYAYAVDVVAPGDYYYNDVTQILNVRDVLQYTELDFVSGPTGGEPTTPEIDDIFYDNQLLAFAKWDGNLWIPLLVTVENGVLPQPDVVEADTIDIVNGTGPLLGVNDSVEITFPESVVGAVTTRGFSFDTPAVNRKGSAVPVIEGLENRPSAAAFDGNKGSYFKSKRVPTERNPLALQYTYWVGDPARYPNIVEYSITAKDTETGPKSWKLMMNVEGQWITVDQQSGYRFEDGETRVFPISE